MPGELPYPSLPIEIFHIYTQFIILYVDNYSQNPRAECFFFSFLYSYMCVCLFVSHSLTKLKTVQTLNLAHILLFTIIQNPFFEKATLGATSLEKLPCHVDFPHISSISLVGIFFFTTVSKWRMQDQTRTFFTASQSTFY